MYRIGIDVGGTFTDLVSVDHHGEPRVFKTPSTPSQPSLGVINGLRDIAESYGIKLNHLLENCECVIHGSTVATNTLVERKGSVVGLLTTEGFRDILEMREGLKEDRYNLHMEPIVPLIPRHLRIDVRERIKSTGEVYVPLDLANLDKALDVMAERDVEALAVCFLFSFMNPEHERQAKERIRKRFPDHHISLSHEVIPQINEFDRVSTTAINAYVGPRFSRYLRDLEDGLSALKSLDNLLIMQSNGGIKSLRQSERLPVGAILSGPAGGVRGAIHYGSLVCESNIIALDMGGTSTDISLSHGGTPTVSSERFESGWKIATPMIDIRTLGAGGGSIARIDEAGFLQIGPESAGADPGPVSYGRGGKQPTVTDANLVLGYIDSASFFGGRKALDRQVAVSVLEEQIANPLKLSVEEGAAGIHKLASNKISEGIRLMSVAKGVDPRDYSIVAYGGASGLQACEAARELGIQTVYFPDTGPVLSAYGMLTSDLRYDFSRSFPTSIDEIAITDVREILKTLEQSGRAHLKDHGIPDSHVEVDRAADMRYLDQIYDVSVPIPSLDIGDSMVVKRWKQNFHKRYEELYSYRQSDQEIRLVTLRVSVIGRLPGIGQLPIKRDVEVDFTPLYMRAVYIDKWRTVPIYELENLSDEATIKGPAIIQSNYTSVLIAEGDLARSDQYGGVMIEISNLERNVTNDTGRDAIRDSDPVTMSVIGNKLESIAEEMMEVMLRTSMSQILNSSRDFSTAILDTDCQLVAQGEGLPVHTSALPVSGSAVLQYFGDEIAEGDLFILNDPYAGGSHLPDITVIKPIFHKGELVFMSVNRAHHSDVGGATHGGYNPLAEEIYQEGIRIPPLRIQSKGEPIRDLINMLAANVRLPENFLGDLNAQIGSVDVAAERVVSLIESYGARTFMSYTKQIMDSTEQRVRSVIEKWPDGVYKGESFIDDDGFGEEMIPIRVTITIAGDSMVMDFSDSSSQVKGFINSVYANTRSIAHAAMMYMIPGDIPKNEGSLRPVGIIAPKGSIVNACEPAPVCMSTNHCAEEIIEAIFKAMARAAPDVVNSGFSRRLRYAITGTDERTGRRFIWHFFMARGGGGSSAHADGWNTVGENQAVGGMRAPSVEITEERFPLFVVKHELRPNSGGAGRWRGGLGSICEIVYEGTGTAILNTAGDGIHVPPYGLEGGGSGLPHSYFILSEDGERHLKSKEAGVRISVGDKIVCHSSGGGGYGDPAERLQELRDRDVINGYIL